MDVGGRGSCWVRGGGVVGGRGQRVSACVYVCRPVCTWLSKAHIVYMNLKERIDEFREEDIYVEV